MTGNQQFTEEERTEAYRREVVQRLDMLVDLSKSMRAMLTLIAIITVLSLFGTVFLVSA